VAVGCWLVMGQEILEGVQKAKVRAHVAISVSAPGRHSGMLLAGIQVLERLLDPGQEHAGVTGCGGFLDTLLVSVHYSSMFLLGSPKPEGSICDWKHPVEYGYKYGYAVTEEYQNHCPGGRIMENQCSIAEAKNKLPSIIHAVEKGFPVKLTRYGRAVAVLLSIKEYERLSLRSEGFWRALESFRGLMEKEDVPIDGGDFEGLRDGSHGREVELS
jgi:antitoxin Phd